MKDLEKTQGDKFQKSRITSENPRQQEADAQS
jgi:hypothetical protein